MTNFNSDKWKNMSKPKRIEFLDKLTKNADSKLNDTQLLIGMIANYKSKLAIERAKN